MKEEYNPLGLSDLHEGYKDIFLALLPMLISNTLLCVGEAGYGKTLLMTILAFAVARYQVSLEALIGNIVTAAIRTSPEIDFFRGEPGLRWIPCLFDDGDLSEQRIRVLKSFFDASMQEAMTFVRWGATKFVRSQARFAGDNAYNPDVEPTVVEWLFATMHADKAARTTAILIEMIKPAFPSGLSAANIAAMLKRCSVLLNTKTHLYVRHAGIKSCVEQHPLLTSYLKPHAHPLVKAWLKKSVKRDAEEHEAVLEYESRVVTQAMGGLPTRPAPAAVARSSGAFSRVLLQVEQTDLDASPVAPRRRTFMDEHDDDVFVDVD